MRTVSIRLTEAFLFSMENEAHGKSFNNFDKLLKDICKPIKGLLALTTAHAIYCHVTDFSTT